MKLLIRISVFENQHTHKTDVTKCPKSDVYKCLQHGHQIVIIYKSTFRDSRLSMISGYHGYHTPKDGYWCTHGCKEDVVTP